MLEINKFMKNVLFTLISNFIPFIVSVLMVLIIPKIVSVYDYGLWQFFLFCFSYIGCLHLGWNDGIYLRFAGESYDNLKDNILPGQLRLFILFEFIITVIILIVVQSFVENFIKRDIVSIVAGLIIIANFNSLINLIFQCTSRFKEYAKVTSLDPIMFLMGCICLYISGNFNYRGLVYIKIFSLMVVFVVSAYFVRDLITKNFKFDFSKDIREAKINIIVGFKLTLSNLSNLIILGIIRYGISVGWNISTFGKVSLSLTISNFFMLFINAISVVLLPYLKHMDDKYKKEIYIVLRMGLNYLLYFLLVFFYPLKIVLTYWLPMYNDSLSYIAILLPVCLFESRMALLINTYLKAYRKESFMLIVNMFIWIFSIILTYISVNIFHNLVLCFFSVIILFGMRCILFDIYLMKKMLFNPVKPILFDILMILSFIYSFYVIESIGGLGIYFLSYIIYMLFNLDGIKKVILFLKTKS